VLQGDGGLFSKTRGDHPGKTFQKEAAKAGGDPHAHAEATRNSVDLNSQQSNSLFKNSYLHVQKADFSLMFKSSWMMENTQRFQRAF